MPSTNYWLRSVPFDFDFFEGRVLLLCCVGALYYLTRLFKGVMACAVAVKDRVTVVSSEVMM